MSILVDFTTNSSKGFQLADSVLDAMQTEYQRIIEAIGSSYGNYTVLKGITDVGLSGSFTPGLVFWNDEFFYFEGGVFDSHIIVSEVTTQLEFQADNNLYDAFTVRTLQFAGAVPGGGSGFAVTKVGNPVYIDQFCYPRTICVLDGQVTTNIANISGNTTNISTNTGNIATLQATVISLQNQIDAFGGADFEVGDIRFVKDISNFDGATGLGASSTNREDWVVVGNNSSVAIWVAALGLPGGTVWTDVQDAVVALAGGINPVSTIFGDKTKTISVGQLPAHTHGTGTLVTASDGAHTHDIETDNDPAGLGLINTGGSVSSVFTNTTESAGAHTHAISGNTASEGGGGSLNVEQRSLALYMIVKYQ